MTHQLSRAGIRAEVAELLYLAPDEVPPGENLFALGLDSVGLIGLVERWRAAGARVSFVELAERPTLAEWWELLAGG
ncbi:phosphopantetheine-binding protein [Allokutzneria sp. A3M-2-11 16]|uniref:phosphopantetheine-binding protein n=1 Tax=Allokutzneria sp. A3M-2-11 16 TaxID=2962043 RepID=UPI0020B795EB|nr:phosphopantetheine-binding protein [Allokutzneria sp. A3M-2-11 16]MCP3804809.1 phosphopantetheine-binding protein [Allokutzneria sp. A3M-2-11 16]